MSSLAKLAVFVVTAAGSVVAEGILRRFHTSNNLPFILGALVGTSLAGRLSAIEKIVVTSRFIWVLGAVQGVATGATALAVHVFWHPFQIPQVTVPMSAIAGLLSPWIFLRTFNRVFSLRAQGKVTR